MKIVIRACQKDDLPAIRTITWDSWVSTYSSFIPESDLRSYFDIHYTEASFLSMYDHPFMQVFVAEADDRIAGYVRLFFNHDENRLYVPSLYFLPGFQGQGMGKRLLEAAEEYAAEKGVNELWIGVMVQNTQALVFYRKVGFQFVREQPFTMGKTTVRHLIGYKKFGRGPLFKQKIYVTFDGGGSLSELCLDLLSDQKKAWQDFREGCELLKDIREREVPCRGFSVRLQYNPGRIKSTAADVKEKDGRERRCFLCLDHLPQEQKGILYREDYLILCNPIPVFSSHFTVSHLDHRRQAIEENIDTLLQLMADFGSGWVILYNGPKCGASAPDHLHFQVGPSGTMPIEEEIHDEGRPALVKQIEGVSVYHVRDLGREVIILEGNDPVAVKGAFEDLLNALKKVLLIDEEPMMNVAGFYKKGNWRLILFPRRKHRPDAFFRDGNDRMVLSPGVIDMGGLLITPVEKDFDRLKAATVEDIYGEISLEGKTVERAIDVFRSRL